MALSPLGISLMQQQPIMPAHPGQVAPTNTLGAYQLTGNMAEQQYQAQIAQQNALWGGLAGLGGAGIIGASKIPAITNSISNWITPGSAPISDSALASGASSLGDWMSDPAFASLLPSSIAGAADAGTGAAADAGADAFGSVAGNLAAAAPAAAAGTDAAAGGGLALADLFPFLFA